MNALEVYASVIAALLLAVGFVAGSAWRRWRMNPIVATLAELEAERAHGVARFTAKGPIAKGEPVGFVSKPKPKPPADPLADTLSRHMANCGEALREMARQCGICMHEAMDRLCLRRARETKRPRPLDEIAQKYADAAGITVEELRERVKRRTSPPHVSPGRQGRGR